MRPFEEEFRALNEALQEMGGLVAQSIHRSVLSLVEKNEDYASQVLRDEARVDQLEIQIDDLAASLITRPPLIFLDEPTTGLDPRTRGQMWGTIRGLVAEGCTILLTTQYLDEADQLADRVAVIDRGRKVAEGSPDELKASVGNSTLQLALAPGADLDLASQVVYRIVGEAALATPEAGRLNVPLEEADRAADVLIALRQASVGIAAVSVTRPTLDEVFLAITGHDAGQTDGPGTDDHDERDEVALEVR